MHAPMPCPHCGCETNSPAHAVLAALGKDDLDAAIEAGLLQAVACAGCSSECLVELIAARDTRLRALAARDRYRARNARLQRRTEERAAQRAPVATTKAVPPLPAAAAAALARAKAKAAERSRR